MGKGKKGDKATKQKAKGHGKFEQKEFKNTTPEGQLKDFSQAMDKTYSPRPVEAAWDAWWEKQGYYKPHTDKTKETFTIVIPPPNVTGTLHLGHALTCAVEDALVRWNRMCGKRTLWVPGFDHAGIATQVVVEKRLMRETGQSRHDLGRDNFLKEVWKWTDSNSGTIRKQLRRLGASVDWSRGVFTMDENRSKAVNEAFVRMFESGYIYRSDRLVNWSCSLRTAISSIEVNHKDIATPTLLKVPGHDEQVEFGVLHSFAYKVKGTDEEIVVATTRIETMLGDVAVAVHPDDPRYKHLQGKELEHPFIPERKMIVITDPELVDMKFGTGAVKITPAHDPNDFACGQRHKLELINILDDTGLINNRGGPFQGKLRFVARREIIEQLCSLGLYRGKEPNPMVLGICSRSGDVVEPVIRPQWWVKCDELAARAVKMVRQKQLHIVPEMFEQTWFDWLENIRDWCISRQLWWGHRIPAYWVEITDEQAAGVPRTESKGGSTDPRWVVARTEAEAKAIAAKRFPRVPAAELSLRQDEDVLDTWFSSGLFPFSVMNWPENTDDLKDFYPTQLLETGHDILFFWVARMVMMGLALTDRLPFTYVYLHAMVRDKIGRKMSKSLGNVLDPIDVMSGVTLEQLHTRLLTGNLDKAEVARAKATQKQEFPEGIAECGADALRFALCSYTAQGRDINLDPLRIVAYRQFCNKLWQATSFARMHVTGRRPVPKTSRNFVDRWVLHRTHMTVLKVDQCMKSYDFAGATTALYDFWYKELCAVYLETIKPVLYAEGKEAEPAKEDARTTLWTCYDIGFRLVHPFMPFVTEELWHRLGAPTPECPSIMIAEYPVPAMTAAWHDPDLERPMEVMTEVSHAIRALQMSLGLTGKERLPVHVQCSADQLAIVRDCKDTIITLSNVSDVLPLDLSAPTPPDCLSHVVSGSCKIHLPTATLGSMFHDQVMKLERKLEDLEPTLEKIHSTLKSTKLPDSVRQKTEARLKEKQEEQKGFIASVAKAKSFMTPEAVAAAELAVKKDRLERKLKDARKYLKQSTKKLTQMREKFGDNPPAKQKIEIEKLVGKVEENKADVARLEQTCAQLFLSCLQLISHGSPIQS